MGCDGVKVYCGPDRIISSLAWDTAGNYARIESQTTNMGVWGDGTPACLIDRRQPGPDCEGGRTVAERLSLTALGDVVSRSGIPLGNPSTLLIISTTKGNIECITDDFQRSYLWALADTIADHFGCSNRPLIVSNACVSGVAAIVAGARYIRRGEYEHVYILGVDVASDFVVSGFNSFKSVSPTLCRPYDRDRDGLTLGEACGAMLLTRDRRLSESKIVVSGGGMADDANHISGPSRTGDGLQFAIETALRQAGVEARQIGFVNAHGTGTPFNDEMESKALHAAALDGVPCNSLKPYLGHTLGASGVVETILSAAQLRNNRIFGVKGYRECGVPFRLNVSADHRDADVQHCLKTASGFGGTNAAVVLSKEEALPGTTGTAGSQVCAGVQTGNRERATGPTGIEVCAQVHIGRQEGIPFAEYIKGEYKRLGESNMKFFKMDNLSKLGYVASCRLMQGVELPYAPQRIGVVLCNRSSSLDTDLRHQQIVDLRQPEGASPSVFVYTLANIVAAEIAIRHRLQGELSFFVCRRKDVELAADYARLLIEEDICDAVVCGWCEMLGDEYDADLKLIKKQ